MGEVMQTWWEWFRAKVGWPGSTAAPASATPSAETPPAETPLAERPPTPARAARPGIVVSTTTPEMAWRRIIGRQPEACAADAGSIRTLGFHGFAAAAHYAFAKELPLALSPDHIWLCIAQGLARHVGLDPSRHRQHFVAHEGKVALSVRRDDFLRGAPNNPWPEVFSAFSEQVREHLGPTHELLQPRFTTTTPLSRSAAEIVLLDMIQSYFKLELRSRCGIPELRLGGVPDDWLQIQTRVQQLAPLLPEPWAAALDPILGRLVQHAEGRSDAELVASLYKLSNASGGPYATGWINLLFPYLQDHRGQMFLNPGLSRWQDLMTARFGGGLTTTAFPGPCARAPFRWLYRETAISMAFYGGFIGVGVSKEGEVRPALGWAVAELADGPAGPPRRAEDDSEPA